MKIAVFGGSTIAGFGIELTAPMILEHELSKLSGCYFVKNLASPGAYMTGYGDSVLRSLDEFYDHFLVYSGHNELLSLVDDDYQVNLIKDDFKSEKSYWSQRAAKLVRAHFNPSESIVLAENRFTFGLPYGLVSKSRVIALAARISRYPEDYLNRMKEFILQAIASAEASKNRFPNVLERDRVVEHISSIPIRYQDSLQELNQEKTLLSTVSGNLFFHQTGVLQVSIMPIFSSIVGCLNILVQAASIGKRLRMLTLLMGSLSGFFRGLTMQSGRVASSLSTLT